jgi:metallo-beta-lactamase family protein
MKLTFYGAAREVTGSCYLLEACGKRILIDCGLEQGRDEKENQQFPFAAQIIDFVLVTHAHIDHSGRLPLLIKNGFSGAIFATGKTCELLSIMLRDSAHIQEQDAEWQNRKGKRAGKTLVEPLYSIIDAQNTLKYFNPCSYEQKIEISDGIEIRFIDAGHLLGSSCIEIWLTEDGVTKKIVFSGDIGNLNQPIIRNPKYINDADYVVTESTYGNKNHEKSNDYTEDLAKIIEETFTNGGNVIIPSFAVGRTQELLYFIREIKERRLIKSVPNFKVFVDSPLAAEATKIYDGDLTGYCDEETIALLKSGVNPIKFNGLIVSETSDESKSINEIMEPKIIISASGMCDAGRIRHHLKHNLFRSECAIVFVGFQAEETLGRTLIEGAKSVKLFGEQIAVKARIYSFRGLSAHADRDGLLKWINSFETKLSQVFVVHGETGVSDIYAQTLRELGLPAHVPDYSEVYDLATNTLIKAGVVSQQPKSNKNRESSAFLRLQSMTDKLNEVILLNKGAPNKELAKFTDQLNSLIEKWK